MVILRVRTVDTDVVVVLIGVFHKLLLSQPKVALWVTFGEGKNYRLHSIDALMKGDETFRCLKYITVGHNCQS